MAEMQLICRDNVHSAAVWGCPGAGLHSTETAAMHEERCKTAPGNMPPERQSPTQCWIRQR